ncbi:MAG: 6-carboxytetrahydropterin synthase [Planctomycetota bacterium]|nr:6-carboxytetrahydropterin synthase [Planctomycetota bacterium]MDA1114272.1 6-carboxytetrahydropterin synthase [Planctomycetota bacterium]
MESWSIEINKEYLKFSAAHFLIFPDGSSERLHGHNYQVSCAISGALSEFGLVLDFKRVKPIIRELVDALDEYWLIPGEHPVLKWNERDDEVIEIRYRELYYAAPKSDVVILPLRNISAEKLASFLGRALLERIRTDFPEMPVESLKMCVEETSGQQGCWTFTA